MKQKASGICSRTNLSSSEVQLLQGVVREKAFHLLEYGSVSLLLK